MVCAWYSCDLKMNSVKDYTGRFQSIPTTKCCNYLGTTNIPVGKVHPRNVHPILNEFEEGGRLPRNWANGANNSGEPHLVRRAVHVQVRNKLHLQVKLQRLIANWEKSYLHG